MLKRSVLSLSRSRGAFYLWLEDSIPHHSIRDVLALATYSEIGSMKTSDLEKLLSHIETRMFGFPPELIFPLLSLLIRTQNSFPVPRSILDEIADCLCVSSGHLNSSEYIRSLELLASLRGIVWDPVVFNKSTPLLRILGDADGHTLGKIAMLKLNKSVEFHNRLDAIKHELTGVQRSKVAYFSGDGDLLGSPSDNQAPATVMYALRYFAAWGDKPDRHSWMNSLRPLISCLSASEAQWCLFSLIALGESPQSPLLQELEDIAEQSKWDSLQARNICDSIMKPDSCKRLPVRIPQLGVERKQGIVNMLGTTRNIIYSDFICDIRVNERHAIIATVPWDPDFRIFCRFLPSDILLVDSTRVNEPEYISQLFRPDS